MIQNKKKFEVEIDGVAKKFAVLRPTHDIERQAQYVYCRSFKEAVDNKVMLRDEVDSLMRQRNLWDDAKQKEFEKLQKSLLEGTVALKAGGIKKSAGRSIAIQMRKDRWEINNLTSERNKFDAVTAEALAEDASFRFKVAHCTVYEDNGNKYFASYEDYLAREEDPVTLPASNALGALIYNLEDDYRKKLPENEFLLKYKFCNNDLRLIDKDGNLIDLKGRRINDKNYLINEQGEPIDENGKLLTNDGEYKVEFSEFLDD